MFIPTIMIQPHSPHQNEMQFVNFSLQLYDIEENDDFGTKLSFAVPKDLAAGFINNKKEEYSFQFERSFDQNVKQDEVFEYVAKDVIDRSVLCGHWVSF